MTEAQYILIRDLSSIISARDALNHITPANSPQIDKAEFQSVLAALGKWEDAMSEAVQTERDKTESRLEELEREAWSERAERIEEQERESLP